MNFGVSTPLRHMRLHMRVPSKANKAREWPSNWTTMPCSYQHLVHAPPQAEKGHTRTCQAAPHQATWYNGLPVWASFTLDSTCTYLHEQEVAYNQILKQNFFLPKLLASEYQVICHRNVKEEVKRRSPRSEGWQPWEVWDRINVRMIL